METKEKIEAVTKMIDAAYRTISAAENFVSNDDTEPCWTIRNMLSNLSSFMWTLSRLIENQKTEE